MKSLKWEGIGTKNLFPHTSNLGVVFIYTVAIDRNDDWLNLASKTYVHQAASNHLGQSSNVTG